MKQNFDFTPELDFVTSQGRPTPYAHDLPDMIFLYPSLATSFGAIVRHSNKHPPSTAQSRYHVLPSMPCVQPCPQLCPNQLDARPADIKGRPTIYPSTYPNILSLSISPRCHSILLPWVSGSNVVSASSSRRMKRYLKFEIYGLDSDSTVNRQVSSSVLPLAVGKEEKEKHIPLALGNRPKRLRSSTRCLDHLSSGEKRAGCADLVTLPSRTFLSV